MPGFSISHSYDILVFLGFFGVPCSLRENVRGSPVDVHICNFRLRDLLGASFVYGHFGAPQISSLYVKVKTAEQCRIMGIPKACVQIHRVFPKINK